MRLYFYGLFPGAAVLFLLSHLSPPVHAKKVASVYDAVVSQNTFGRYNVQTSDKILSFSVSVLLLVMPVLGNRVSVRGPRSFALSSNASRILVGAHEGVVGIHGGHGLFGLRYLCM